MKRVREAAKSVAFLGLGSSPYLAWRLHRIKRSGLVTVLNLHKVSDRKDDVHDCIAPLVFDELVGWLKGRFRIVTFGDLAQGVPGAKPPLVLSFDDGYRDFIDVVAPILRKHGVRANQNVVPDCVDRGQAPLNVVLRDFITQAPKSLLRELVLPGLPQGVDPDDRPRVALQASVHFKNLTMAEQKRLWAELSPTIAKFDAFRPAPVMCRADILQLAGEHEFGLHSFEHATMSAESDEYVSRDAVRCQEWWSSLTGKPASIYAFPNGAAAKRHLALVQAAGFTDLLLVNEAFSQPRARVHDRLTMFGFSRPEARFRALGSFAPIPAPIACAPASAAPRSAPSRVAFLVPLLGPAGGTERVTNAVMQKFIEQGVAVDLVAIARYGDLPMDLPAGVNVIELNLSKLRYCVDPLRKYLKTNRPDALVASLWPLTVYAVLSKLLSRTSTRVLVCDHNMLSAQYRFMNFMELAWLRASIFIFYRLADACIAVSEGVAQDIRDLARLPRKTVTVIENPVPWLQDLKSDDHARESPPAWRHASKRILTVGNLKPQKNHVLLVRAFARIAVENDAVLMIVGSGSEGLAISAMAQQCGVGDRVVLYGVARNPTPLYRSADLFVLSSDYEGFGLVLVEAMQFGLPIVSTDCPSGPSTILEGGRYGTLVPPGDVGSLSRAIAAGLHAPVDAAAQIRRAKEYLPEAAVTKYFGLAVVH